MAFMAFMAFLVELVRILGLGICAGVRQLTPMLLAEALRHAAHLGPLVLIFTEN
ncbi:hypothetical protein METH_17740 [Leisingera methylohalidivorans DSM 14336]|uniref:Uncharacterized protein n=1 Tax=Leisingera methylohalidivorans DSM 14336 TaxID=999552 RepID=V9VZB6_9RHOB|nr:hypothetical protein METH_17740 [Leisingera methylohalidivorans DSM 14336]